MSKNIATLKSQSSRAYSKDVLIIHIPMASAGAPAYNGGLGAEPQPRSRGQRPRWDQGAKPP